MSGGLCKYIKDLRNLIKFNGKKHLVLGNEAADMDSVIGSIVYAYYKHVTNQSKSIVLPFNLINPKHMELRKDIIIWLKEAGIDDTNNLLYIDDLNNTFDKDKSVSISLIDHHKPVNHEFVKLVSEVIDHREKIFDFPPGQLSINEIHLVGSCCTLLAEIFLNSTEFKDKNVLLKLVYGVILLDTENFRPEIGKTTARDVAVIENIEKVLQLDKSERSNVLHKLMTAKGDMTGVPLELAVFKDLKVFEFGKIKIAIPALINFNLIELIMETNFLLKLESIRQDLNAENLIIISSMRDGRRQYLLHLVSSELNERLCDHLCKPEFGLDIQSIYRHFDGKVITFYQNHLLTSRKKFVPLLDKFF